MNDRVFMDSNILIYSYSNSEIGKQKKARQLIADNTSYISTQVLQELCNTVTRKFDFTYEQAAKAIQECCQNNRLYINTENTIMQACLTAKRYFYSFYDSLIIAAALKTDCTILYSEDLQDGQIIDEKLTIINPFK